MTDTDKIITFLVGLIIVAGTIFITNTLSKEFYGGSKYNHNHEHCDYNELQDLHEGRKIGRNAAIDYFFETDQFDSLPVQIHILRLLAIEDSLQCVYNQESLNQ